MIEGVKPYAEYKESGQKWLGQVPGHWSMRRLRASISDCANGVWGSDPNGKDDLICVRVADFDRVSHRVSLKKKTLRAIPLSARSRRLLRNGDLLLEKSGGGDLQPVGAVVSYDHDDPAVCSNFVARMPLADGYDSHFAVSLHFTLYASRINVLSIKQTTGIQNLDSKAYLREVVAFPPPEEQAAIVRFLDHANRKIDGFIRAKRKLIGLLNEQKQAIIHRAVTRGLHPDVPLKPSGIPWLGDIPKHWDVRPIKHWTKINARTLGEATAASFEFRYIDIGAVRTGRLVAAPEVMRFDRSPSRARRVLVAGDTIISTVRTYLKAVWFAGENPVNLVASTGFAVFSPLASVEPEYLSYVLQDSGFVDQVTGNSVGIAYPAIAESVLARLRIAIPPSRSEQVGIIVAIKDQTGPLNTAISRTEREIALMQEYRTRLTADLVTGKLDVREAAAQLPAPPNDAPAPDEPLEEIETELEETNDASN